MLYFSIKSIRQDAKYHLVRAKSTQLLHLGKTAAIQTLYIVQGTSKSVTLVKAVVKILSHGSKTHQYQVQLHEQADTHIRLCKTKD